VYSLVSASVAETSFASGDQLQWLESTSLSYLLAAVLVGSTEMDLMGIE